MKTEKPFKYHKREYDSIICFNCDTDFSKYDYKPSFTIFKKGWFREHEQEVVLMITDIMKPQHERYKYIYFKKQKDALNYIKKQIENFKK